MYKVKRRSIDAGHGCSCPDEYEVRNEERFVCQLTNESTANWIADRLNENLSLKEQLAALKSHNDNLSNQLSEQVKSFIKYMDEFPTDDIIPTMQKHIDSMKELIEKSPLEENYDVE